ncbi:beta-ketoacyl-[acyl-carrier-protein] synthase family protein [Phenylobacterium sp.]|uniref:beta-ketoacyl-[acyl-carrier-protein] synthase family protein n=1 Tax=Phenylobacterium sp. TaxID=1871053 RepID=UPI0011F42130|nr:beta-ketoacyl-[acyl-carrier-protein] synthase family protein [Phenylobacterium sp.]THD72785.1 MAG: beta-ketoacyl-[acyl-carrier-protein] synthase family protein [Phenylobacterium sp.]
MNRIAVTGLGAISALGASVEANWQAVRDGRGGIERTIMGDSPYGPGGLELPMARVAPGYEAALDAGLGKPAAGGLDPFARMALAPALEALEQSGLRGNPTLTERTAVILGHGLGGLATLEAGYERFFGMKSPKLHPSTVPRVMLSAGVSAVAMAFEIRGPVFAVSSACASSSHAIAQGAAMIALGQVDCALVGGSEAISTAGCVRAWDAIRAMSPTTCRPFSADRDGMVLGEGGAVLMLEAMDHAEARGATILGELIGWGMSSDAFHITQPSPEGQARAMRQAATQAGVLERDDILVSAHGTGTPLNDAAETQSLVEVFGERARTLPVIATKSAHGHLIGGSAALQAVIGLRALAEGLAPPIQNFNQRDPACDLNLVLGEAQPIASRLLLQNAFAFGGLNVALVFAAV